MEEQRKSARKLVKVKALVKAEGGAPVLGRTFDLGRTGVGVLLDVPLREGIQARVSVGLLLDGVVTPIHTQARVEYCIFSSGAYRIGFHFLQVDFATTTLLGRFLH